MKNTILRYGLYSALTIFVLFISGWFIGKALELGFAGQEVVGYATIILSLSFVFFGIKHFRDKQNNGMVSFGKALSIGLLISLFAALAFGIIDVIYRYLNPDFVNEYYAYQTSQLETTLSGAELEAALSEMESQREMFSSTTMSFLLMSMTVFVIGIVVSLISSLILQRK